METSTDTSFAPNSSSEILQSFKKKNRAVIREIERWSNDTTDDDDSLGVIVHEGFKTPTSSLMAQPNATSTVNNCERKKNNKKSQRRVSFSKIIKTVIDETNPFPRRKHRGQNSSDSSEFSNSSALEFETSGVVVENKNTLKTSKSSKENVSRNKKLEQLKRDEAFNISSILKTSDSDYSHPQSHLMTTSDFPSSEGSRLTKNKRKATKRVSDEPVFKRLKKYSVLKSSSTKMVLNRNNIQRLQINCLKKHEKLLNLELEIARITLSNLNNAA